jgi:hypothetical protein
MTGFVKLVYNDERLTRDGIRHFEPKQNSHRKILDTDEE